MGHVADYQVQPLGPHRPRCSHPRCPDLAVARVRWQVADGPREGAWSAATLCRDHMARWLDRHHIQSHIPGL